MRTTSGSELITLRKRQLPQRPQHVLVMKRKSKVPLRGPFHSHICGKSESHKVFHSTGCDGLFAVAADEPADLNFPSNSKISQEQSL